MADARPAAADGAPGAVTRALLEDGSLALSATPEAWEAVAAWVPRFPPRAAAPAEVRAWICVEAGPPAFPRPAEEPDLLLRASAGWLRPSGRVLLCEPGLRTSAVIDPAGLRADVRVDAPGEAARALGVEIFEALTVPAALLLGRMGRTLVHAGAVAAPGGRAWLLAGGTFSGKSTTCTTLIRGGWDWLGDDHVLLGRDAAGLPRVEGWPRKFNLDHGYAAGASIGVRERVDPDGFGPGRWRRTAPLGGVLFPRVEAERPTALARLAAADALARLLDLSPWLLVDPGAAPSILALLGEAARTPAYELRLGGDCYGDSVRLQQVLTPVLGPGEGGPAAGHDANGPAGA